jgi:ferritin
MNTNRLSKTLSDALNTQMATEAYASQIYLSYGSWAQHHGYPGIATFLFRHAEEERSHMLRLMEYILTRGDSANVVALAAPPANPTSLHACFEHVYEHEVANTKSIYKIVKMSMEEEDWATWNLMQWFVKEQIEEETFATNLLDRLKLAGGEKANGNALYELDKDLGKPVPIVEKMPEGAETWGC